MRFGATIIAAQMLVTVAIAQTPSEKAVSILNEVCVVPTSSEERMTAGEKAAVKENWKLIWSKAIPTPLKQNENAKTVMSAWEFNLPEGSRARLIVGIMRPELPDYKDTYCLIESEIILDSDDITQSIDRQFGSAVTKDVSGRFKHEKRWFFTAEKSAGNCGKYIWVPLGERGKTKTLTFHDFVYSSDWPAAELARCPN